MKSIKKPTYQELEKQIIELERLPKENFLKEAADNNYYLFMEHDAHNEVITLKNTEKGVRLNKVYNFNELFS